jgi:hypothetical protein
MPDPDPGQVAVLGADDVATRKGQHYATVLVDMETHQGACLIFCVRGFR